MTNFREPDDGGEATMFVDLKTGQLRQISPAEALQELHVAETTDIKTTLADEAKRIVSGARRTAYGTPEQNFERIARLWNSHLVNVGILDIQVMADPEAKGGISPGDVSLMMALMKIARMAETPDHYDSYVDLVGYTLTAAEVNGVRKPIDTP